MNSEVVLTTPVEVKNSVRFAILEGRAMGGSNTFSFVNTSVRNTAGAVTRFDIFEKHSQTQDVTFLIGKELAPLLSAKPATPGTVEAFAGSLLRTLPGLQGISEEDLTRIHERRKTVTGREF